MRANDFSGKAGSRRIDAGRQREMIQSQDWNRRVLEALEQTFPYDAKLMTFFVQEGERQNQLYAERLAAFRKKVEEMGERCEYSNIAGAEAQWESLSPSPNRQKGLLLSHKSFPPG